jgi:hypothetical protein
VKAEPLIVSAIRALGVHGETLKRGSPQLRDEGFVHLPSVLSEAHLTDLRQLCDRTSRSIPTGNYRIEPCDSERRFFRPCYTAPEILIHVWSIFEADFSLCATTVRVASPGLDGQPLHCDWLWAVRPPEWTVCNTIWMVDDFTAHNGATRFVPGSHRYGTLPSPKTLRVYPRNEVVVQGRAGDVIVLNGHTWHGGTLNQTGIPRRAVTCLFRRIDNSFPRHEIHHREGSRNH